MKISGLFSAFSGFPFKSQNAEQTPCQEERFYVLNESNRREEFTDENIKGFLNMIGKYSLYRLCLVKID